MTGGRIPVYLELGDKLVFASAVDWPGWCRRGRSENEALEALLVYGPRYARVSNAARQTLDLPGDVAAFEVVERLVGGSGTDFGVAGMSPRADEPSLEGAELERGLALLAACWDAFDRAAAGAIGRELRKGPRGGGRDLGKIQGHVLEAEDAYLNQLGARPPKRAGRIDVDRQAHRDAVLAALRARSRGEDPPNPSGTRQRWTPRRFIRRACWHLLDHAWEIEDRAET